MIDKKVHQSRPLKFLSKNCVIISPHVIDINYENYEDDSIDPSAFKSPLTSLTGLAVDKKAVLEEINNFIEKNKNEPRRYENIRSLYHSLTNDASNGILDELFTGYDMDYTFFDTALGDYVKGGYFSISDPTRYKISKDKSKIVEEYQAIVKGEDRLIQRVIPYMIVTQTIGKELDKKPVSLNSSAYLLSDEKMISFLNDMDEFVKKYGLHERTIYSSPKKIKERDKAQKSLVKWVGKIDHPEKYERERKSMKKILSHLKEIFETHKENAENVDVVTVLGMFDDCIYVGDPKCWELEQYEKLLLAEKLPSAWLKIEAPNVEFEWKE